jgi:hypothetical protein
MKKAEGFAEPQPLLKCPGNPPTDAAGDEEKRIGYAV